MSRDNWIKKLKECSKEYQASKQVVNKKSNNSPKKNKVAKVYKKISAPKIPDYKSLPDNQSRAIAKTIFNLEARPYIRQQMKLAQKIRGSII